MVLISPFLKDKKEMQTTALPSQCLGDLISVDLHNLIVFSEQNRTWSLEWLDIMYRFHRPSVHVPIDEIMGIMFDYHYLEKRQECGHQPKQALVILLSVSLH